MRELAQPMTLNLELVAPQKQGQWRIFAGSCDGLSIHVPGLWQGVLGGGVMLRGTSVLTGLALIWKAVLATS